MKHKVELKKMLKLSIISVIIINLIFLFVNKYEYNKYTENFNSNLSGIIEIIREKYPEIKDDEIVNILNSKSNSNVLKEYGIDLKNDSFVLENDNYYKKFLIVNTGFLILISLILLIIFLKYNYLKDKQLKRITKYIEELNNKNYKLDIDSNSEDELSILKNEIYKTTVMLKETAQNSIDDKIKLKDSLSDISHQLKTPLTTIGIMIDNIIENPNMDEKTRKEFCKDIKREIVNINFLVNSLLKLSKFDANTIKFINKTEKICDILNESIKNVSILGDLKNIKLNIIGNSKDTMNCDFKWQVEALTNILKNSIEHSYDNSEIEIKYEKNNVYTKIEIKDIGIGILEEDLSHIFERFYKGKNSSKDSVGIGLALSKTIIENNNGFISVNSKLNEGTTFIIKYFDY